MQSSSTMSFMNNSIPVDDDENDWTFEEVVVEDRLLKPTSSTSADPILSQLHPAVSMGMHKVTSMHRVNSCYFSIGSSQEGGESMNDLWVDETYKSCGDFDDDNISIIQQFDSSSSSSTDDILYHDILMNVFTYLDAQSLAAFSETARRPNFEVFYFLQLQLQRSLLVDDDSSSCTKQQQHQEHPDQLTAIAGSAILSRLAKLDPSRAQTIVDDYLQSNSTLRRMPLSHSIAYMRHFLQRQGFHHHAFPEGPQALASAALLATVVGAAYLSGEMPQTGELPNLLFRFGFVGSLMGAARQMSDGDVSLTTTSKREEKKEEEEVKENNIKPTTTSTTASAPTPQFRFPSLFEMKETLAATLRDSNANNNNNNNKSSPTNRNAAKPMLSNPYDHHDGKEEEEKVEQEQPLPSRKMPSGCMGAYSRAIQSATASIVEIVKQGRREKFNALTMSQQARNISTLLDACSLNEGLATVQELSHIMDLDASYVGSDGSETCALHTAAFHGASKVVDFLLQGIDDSDPNKDGGLCLVDSRDNNGWTALHFAAGSNSVECVHVLAKHDAKLSLEANNGYSPLQWARRLSNEEVEEALQELLAQEEYPKWRSQPLTSLANRFFSLIPSR